MGAVHVGADGQVPPFGERPRGVLVDRMRDAERAVHHQDRRRRFRSVGPRGVPAQPSAFVVELDALHAFEHRGSVVAAARASGGLGRRLVHRDFPGARGQAHRDHPRHREAHAGGDGPRERRPPGDLPIGDTLGRSAPEPLPHGGEYPARHQHRDRGANPR